MKILHTSDWHIGHMLYGHDRTEEQQSMLDQMVKIVAQERPDVFILAGDVYDTSQPSAAAQTMFNKTIIRLHDTHPDMTIVATAGNHDSGSKHEIFRTPWEYLNVHTIGNLNKENPSSHIIEIPEKGFVIAVPYTHERFLRDGLFQQLIDEVASRNTTKLPVILTAHTSIVGANFSGHENATEKNIGGIDSVDVNNIGNGYDYLALGHIHKPQFIHTGKHNVRYSGTPIAISFDEVKEHTVTLLEIHQYGETLTESNFRFIPIHNPHPLTTIPEEGFAAWEHIKESLRNFPDDAPNYIRLNIKAGDIRKTEAFTEGNNIVNGKKCEILFINIERATDGNENHSRTQLTVEELQQISPIEIARLYAKDTGKVFDEDMEQLFIETLQILNEEEREL